MPEERQVGSLELLECLTEDPFGTVHRGLEWVASRRTREVLVRRYHPAWLALGLAVRQHEIMRNLVHLGNLKPYKGCHASRDGSPQLVWPFAPGRSLDQVMRKTERQGLPFGIDQTLFLVWALSHHIRHLHQARLSPGVLSPHRVWIGFDGWVQLLDVPVMDILEELLPSVPEVRIGMEPYLQGPACEGLARDAFQLGALLFEMLTHQPLPIGQDLSVVTRGARESLPNGTREPVPEAIIRLLDRLLGLSEPFQTLEELERTMEESLFGGDFDPSTFGLAFTMQTLFRQEISDAAMSLSVEAEAPGLPVSAERLVASLPSLGTPPRRSRRTGLLAASCLLVGAALWFGIRALAAPGTEVQAHGNPAPVVTAAPRLPLVPPESVPEPPPPAVIQAPTAPVPPSPAAQPVRVRMFVDEQGRVRQVHIISGAAAGSERERAAYTAVVQKRFPAQPVRSWEETTVMVP